VPKREHIHLIGIGGTGMAALAGLLHDSGCRVTGSDRALYPPTSTMLESLRLEVGTGFDPARLVPSPDLVVIGNAVRRGNPEAEHVLDRDLPYTSMARLLEDRFLSSRHSIVIAGTHGKTTMTSMLASVLHQAGRSPGFLVGGIPANFDRSWALGGGDAFVIEGDEYDTAFFDKGPKFMHYRPDTGVLGTVEFDHADIYRDLDQIKTVFRWFTNLLPGRGLLVRHEDCDVTREVSAAALCRVEGFGMIAGRWRAHDIRHEGDGTRFRVTRDGEPFVEAEVGIPGEHNVRNALAVIAVAADQGLTPKEIVDGLSGFRGVRRRLEMRGEVDGVTVLDDFAHHPTAIAETLRAVRRRFPAREIWAVLEPRSWSMRRRVFQDRLAGALEEADHVVVAAVYAAEQLPDDERLEPDRVVRDLKQRGRDAVHLPDAESIARHVSERAGPGHVVAILSNGGFDGLHDRLLQALQDRSAGGRCGA